MRPAVPVWRARLTAGDTARSAAAVAWERIRGQGRRPATATTEARFLALAATLPGAVVLLGGGRG